LIGSWVVVVIISCSGLLVDSSENKRSKESFFKVRFLLFHS